MVFVCITNCIGLVLRLSGAVPQRAKLKSGAVPNQFSWSPIPLPRSLARMAGLEARHSRNYTVACEQHFTSEVEPVIIVDSGVDEQAVAEVEMNTTSESTIVEYGAQTESKLKQSSVSSHAQTCYGLMSMNTDNFVTDDPGLQFYTGLDNHHMFFTVLASLGPVAFQLNYLYSKNPSIDVPLPAFSHPH